MCSKPTCRNTKFTEEFIEEQNIKSILVALSGGQDSVTLIHLIKNLKIYQKDTVKISYIYIDHQWKEKNNEQIKQMINYISDIQSNIIIYQIKNKKKSENNCRIQRYHTIIEHAIKYNYELILTGHHDNDKIETFFQNIYRGCGIEGINSIVSRNEIYENVCILRPILNLDKHDIYFLCKRKNMPIWSDNTNYFYSIKRNRIRHELVPYIKNFYSTKIQKRIKDLTEVYYYENEYVKQNSMKLYFKIKHPSRIAINHKLLAKHHFALQTRIVQLFIFHNFRVNADSKKVVKIVKQINKNKIKEKIVAEHEQITYVMGTEWMYIKIIQR